ncbi:outer membrane lipoprotein chaperone LolA [Thiomonas bhubaneswarensis]|uniref:Outer-membrane lipoprotein carrier protein n=1 Tax=Thiomonas bhubaneswarensis TaxID=339866 RepID=A0A0K6I3L7_9BURK|nr:outer membrane lipoprotein chaperone LolA [Thiomonas bhubaneswarensis]CUA97628.1 periplasmic chaperone LolA [Thiomonas bhubaneswarensis]
MTMISLIARRRALLRAALLVGALLAAAAPAAMAATSVQLLEQWLKQTRGGSAQFTQTVSNPKGPAQAPAAGQFAFERPDRFRWDYTKPYAQVIVSDGKQLWTYDHDLDQVTITPVTQAFKGTPAAIFAGTDLTRLFTLQALPDANDLQWVQATPQAKDSNFDWIRIGLRSTMQGPEVVELQLRDAFGQVSTMRFSAIKSNPVFAADSFHFTPPKGASVIRQP